MKLPVEIERPSEALNSIVQTEIHMFYQGGKWRAQCVRPPISTLVCDTLEEALVAAVKEITRDWSAGETIGSAPAGKSDELFI